MATAVATVQAMVKRPVNTSQIIMTVAAFIAAPLVCERIRQVRILRKACRIGDYRTHAIHGGVIVNTYSWLEKSVQRPARARVLGSRAYETTPLGLTQLGANSSSCVVMLVRESLKPDVHSAVPHPAPRSACLDVYVICKVHLPAGAPQDLIPARAADHGRLKSRHMRLQDVIVPWCGGAVPAVSLSAAHQAETEKKCVGPSFTLSLKANASSA